MITVAVAVVLPFLLPERFTPGPRWLIPLIEGILLVAMMFADPGRIDKRSARVRRIRIALVARLVIGAGFATTVLTIDLIDGAKVTKSASDLLLSGVLVLADLVIAFAFLFWEFDSGGPGLRSHEAVAHPDFAFPQHMAPGLAPPVWRPVFFDYLYLGLTNSMAFSPTDVMPLTHRAKLAMSIQSMTSLVLVGLVIARAVNVLN